MQCILMLCWWKRGGRLWGVGGVGESNEGEGDELTGEAEGLGGGVNTCLPLVLELEEAISSTL